jgi:hypothetical protein
LWQAYAADINVDGLLHECLTPGGLVVNVMTALASGGQNAVLLLASEDHVNLVLNDPDVRGITTIEEASECDDSSVEVEEIVAPRTRGEKRAQMLETGEI